MRINKQKNNESEREEEDKSDEGDEGDEDDGDDGDDGEDEDDDDEKINKVDDNEKKPIPEQFRSRTKLEICTWLVEHPDILRLANEMNEASYVVSSKNNEVSIDSI